MLKSGEVQNLPLVLRLDAAVADLRREWERNANRREASLVHPRVESVESLKIERQASVLEGLVRAWAA